MRKKVRERVDIYVYILCVSGNDNDLVFQYVRKQHLKAKNDYIQIR